MIIPDRSGSDTVCTACCQYKPPLSQLFPLAWFSFWSGIKTWQSLLLGHTPYFQPFQKNCKLGSLEINEGSMKSTWAAFWVSPFLSQASALRAEESPPWDLVVDARKGEGGAPNKKTCHPLRFRSRVDDKTQGLVRFGTWLFLRRLVSEGRPQESEAFIQLLMPLPPSDAASLSRPISTISSGHG